MTGEKPLYTYKVAGISAAIWENSVNVKGKTVAIQKATVHRRYKNKAGEWQSTQSFGRSDLPVVIHCLQKIYEKMLTEKTANSNNDGTEEEIVM
jgi:hypothetical protein